MYMNMLIISKIYNNSEKMSESMKAQFNGLMLLDTVITKGKGEKRLEHFVH